MELTRTALVRQKYRQQSLKEHSADLVNTSFIPARTSNGTSGFSFRRGVAGRGYLRRLLQGQKTSKRKIEVCEDRLSFLNMMISP